MSVRDHGLESPPAAVLCLTALVIDGTAWTYQCIISAHERDGIQMSCHCRVGSPVLRDESIQTIYFHDAY